MLITVLCVCALCSGHDNELDDRDGPYMWGFLGVYILEAAFKLIALGPTQYYASRRNRFDLFIVVVTVAAVT